MSLNLPPTALGFYNGGETDIARLEIFNPKRSRNPYLNYGLSVTPRPDGTITPEAWVWAQKELVEFTARKLVPPGQSFLNRHPLIIDAGCGSGIGTFNVLKHLYPQAIIGVDAAPAQVERAQALIGNDDRISFQQQDITRLDLGSANGSCTGIYSVEVIQHLSPQELEQFTQRAHDVLAPGGRLAISTFFATGESDQEAAELAKKYVTVEHGLDFFHPIGRVIRTLQEEGFHTAELQSIGNFVFPGLASWVLQYDKDNPLAPAYLQDYNAGKIDYYAVTAMKT